MCLIVDFYGTYHVYPSWLDGNPLCNEHVGIGVWKKEAKIVTSINIHYEQHQHISFKPD